MHLIVLTHFSPETPKIVIGKQSVQTQIRRLQFANSLAIFL